MTSSRKGWRAVALFTLFVWGVGITAGLNYTAIDGLGGLAFILSPLVAALIWRAVTRDWAGAWRLPPRDQWRVMGAAFGLFPVLFAITLGLGAGMGLVTFSEGWARGLALGVLSGLLPVAFFALSEEVAWRGTLDPKLVALGVPPLARHLLVGTIWAVWHLGYSLAGVNQSPLPLALFLPLFFVACLAMAVIYGQWRARTGSFWPAWLAHTVANTLSWPLVGGGLMTRDAPLVFDARPEVLAVLVPLILVAGLTLKRT